MVAFNQEAVLPSVTVIVFMIFTTERFTGPTILCMELPYSKYLNKGITVDKTEDNYSALWTGIDSFYCLPSILGTCNVYLYKHV